MTNFCSKLWIHHAAPTKLIMFLEGKTMVHGSSAKGIFGHNHDILFVCGKHELATITNFRLTWLLHVQILNIVNQLGDSDCLYLVWIWNGWRNSFSAWDCCFNWCLPRKLNYLWYVFASNFRKIHWRGRNISGYERCVWELANMSKWFKPKYALELKGKAKSW